MLEAIDYLAAGIGYLFLGGMAICTAWYGLDRLRAWRRDRVERVVRLVHEECLHEPEMDEWRPRRAIGS